MGVRKLVDRMTKSVEETDREDLAAFCDDLDGLTHLDQLPVRIPVRFGGEITSLRIVPRAGRARARGDGHRRSGGRGRGVPGSAQDRGDVAGPAVDRGGRRDRARRVRSGSSTTRPTATWSSRSLAVDTGAHADLADLVLRIGVTSASTSSPGSNRLSPRGTTRWSVAQDRHDRGLAGDRESRRSSCRRLGRPSARVTSTSRARPSSKRRISMSLPTLTASSTIAVISVRGRDEDVDAPVLREHPLVLGVVDPGDHPGHPELLLGEQRHHEVVLVVTGGGHQHVAQSRAGRPSATRPRTRRRRATRSLDGWRLGRDVPVLLDDEHVVPRPAERRRPRAVRRCPHRRSLPAWPGKPIARNLNRRPCRRGCVPD